MDPWIVPELILWKIEVWSATWTFDIFLNYEWITIVLCFILIFEGVQGQVEINEQNFLVQNYELGQDQIVSPKEVVCFQWIKGCLSWGFDWNLAQSWGQ